MEYPGFVTMEIRFLGSAGRGLLALMLVLSTVLASCSPEKEVPAVTSGSVDVGDTKLFYDEAGEGNPLILLHGGFLAKEMWDGHFERYARNYRVVRYDARNHGLSRSEKATFAHFEDLRKLLDHLKIDKAEDLDPSLREKVRAMARKTLATWNGETKELVASPLAIGRLGEIRVPTLAVVGEIDMPSILDIVGLLEKDLPHLEKAVIPGVAHMVNLEKPREFDRAVQAFLKKVYKKTSSL